jgi:hypothetical protein
MRGICPSCQAKRSTLFAEWVEASVLLEVPHGHVVFTIPRSLRGLVERERWLHGLMARAVRDVLVAVLRAAAGEPDGVPGIVASLQTFGSYANFHPHLHVLVTEGVFTKDGRFHPATWPPRRELEERFRRRFLTLLRRAKRLSAAYHETLLSWRRSGFSVEVSQHVGGGERARLERLARYATRVPLAVGAVHERADGRIEIETPPDPRTGATRLVLTRLDFIHAVCQQIPDRGQHQVRYYGAYANRLRARLREAFEARGEDVPRPSSEETGAAPEWKPSPADEAAATTRASWARLMRRVFEVDPLLCPRCGHRLGIVAWITEPQVVARILKHRAEKDLRSVFEERAPPAA